MRASRALLLTATVVFAASLSGCVEGDPGPGPAASADRRPASDVGPVNGQMTAQTRKEVRSGPCTPAPTGVPVTQAPGRFCATSYFWAEGDIDLVELPVMLETTNGAVTLEFSRGPEWNLTVTGTASNKETLDQARQTAENIAIVWSHEESGGHYLRAKARAKTANCNNNCPQIAIVLQLPDNVLVRAELDSTNGDVTAGGHQYTHLVAESTNGDVILKDSITRDVVLDTTNGNVEIRSRPYESGRWTLDGTNGNIRVSVPEQADYGYEAEGDTTNGAVTISLQGGTTEGDRKHKTFRTHGLDERRIQMRIIADTTNGDVTFSHY